MCDVKATSNEATENYLVNLQLPSSTEPLKSRGVNLSRSHTIITCWHKITQVFPQDK